MTKKEALKFWIENYDGNDVETDLPFDEVFERTELIIEAQKGRKAYER